MRRVRPRCWMRRAELEAAQSAIDHPTPPPHIRSAATLPTRGRAIAFEANGSRDFPSPREAGRGCPSHERVHARLRRAMARAGEGRLFSKDALSRLALPRSPPSPASGRGEPSGTVVPKCDSPATRGEGDRVRGGIDAHHQLGAMQGGATATLLLVGRVGERRAQRRRETGWGWLCAKSRSREGARYAHAAFFGAVRLVGWPLAGPSAFPEPWRPVSGCRRATGPARRKRPFTRATGVVVSLGCASPRLLMRHPHNRAAMIQA
jgi:hypothetical protein